MIVVAIMTTAANCAIVQNLIAKDNYISKLSLFWRSEGHGYVVFKYTHIFRQGKMNTIQGIKIHAYSQ